MTLIITMQDIVYQGFEDKIWCVYNNNQELEHVQRTLYEP